MKGSCWLQTPLPLAAPQSFARMSLTELAQSVKASPQLLVFLRTSICGKMFALKGAVPGRGLPALPPI